MKGGEVADWSMTTNEKRKAYYSLPNDTKKQMAEMTAFKGFVAASNLSVDLNSARNEEPPLPDISCDIDGRTYFFELGEITDEDLAKDVNKSLRTGVD